MKQNHAGRNHKNNITVKSILTGKTSVPEATKTIAESQPVATLTSSPTFKKLKKVVTDNAQRWSRYFKEKQAKKNGLPISGEPIKRSSGAKRLLRILLFPFTNRYFRYLLLILILTSLVGLIYILRDLPSPRRLTSKDNFAVSTQIFDRNGTLLYEIFGDEHRIPIKLDDLPPHVYQAAIAIEDRHFYNHFGFDITGIVRALRNNLQGESVEGGSTITQQLVKNALLSPEKSLKRKAKEGVLAIFTEIIYSKEEILEMYLNYISYGGTSVGIESASKSYFDKSAKDLTIAEAALLAGLPQAPSRYSPFGSNPAQAKARQAEVLRRMAEDNYITEEQADQAEKEVLKFALKKTDIEAPHFVFYVRDWLYEKYGVETVEKGGLRVTTTLDLALQNTVQASVSAEIAKLERYNVGNGAALVLKPNTGEILAMVGSKDYFDNEDDGQVNVTLAFRQPGSSIKPIMYATAFQEKLLNPGTILLDIPTCFSVPGQKPYCPKNYDGSFKGPVSIRQSLGNSLNIPAVKGLKLIGLENFIDQATKMGITTWLDPSRYGLSLTLGGGEVRMIDLAQAFTVVANQGVKVPLTPVLKITDYQGTLIEEVSPDERKRDLADLTEYDAEPSQGDLTRVMDRAPAYLTAHIMQDNSARQAAFGPRSKLVIDNQVVSAKTGTTNDLKDNWTVGFTPEYLVITWVGNNDGSPMNPYLVSGITGAAPIFNNIMTYVLRGKEPVWPEKPPDVLSGKVCIHGLPPRQGENCGPTQTELFWRSSLPSKSRVVKKEIWVRPETGLPPAPGESQDGLALQEKVVYEDPITSGFCADCARPTTEDGKTVYERIVVPNELTTEESEESTETEQ
ncbi:MAG TPA: transglycosylase domain-containing protein [Vitreimonas sp.]|nr:transglycosylase domain-containing protein [Vitreimonas sp.]